MLELEYISVGLFAMMGLLETKNGAYSSNKTIESITTKIKPQGAGAD